MKAAKNSYELEVGVVNQLMAAQSMLYVLPSELKLGEFVSQALKSVPAIDRCSICIRGADQVIGDFSKEAEKIIEAMRKISDDQDHLSITLPVNENLMIFILQTSERTYGCLLLFVKTDSMFENLKSAVTNFINVVAVDLERRRQKAELETHRNNLEKQVEKRTADLQAEITVRKKVEDELRQYEHIVSTSSDMLALLNNRFIYLAANKAYLEAFKLTPDELIGHTVSEVFGEKFFEEVIRPNAERCLTGQKVNYQGWVDFPANRSRYMDVTYYPYRGVNNEIKGFVVNGRNITKRKEAEKALVESERRLKEAQKVAHIGHWELNLVTNELNWSDEIYRMFEIDPKKFGASYEAFLAVIHQDDRDFVNKTYTDSLKNKTEYDIVHRLMFKAKRVKYVNERCRTEYDKEGNPVRSLGIVQDITERHLAQEKIKEYSENLERMVEERTEDLNKALSATEKAKDRIDGILKSVADGLIVTDLHHRVILINRAAEDLLGVRLSDVIGRSIDYAVEEKTLREKIRYTLNKRITGYKFDFEWPGDDPKNPRIMRARTSVIHDKKGKDSGIVTIIHDVTYEREVDRMKTEFLSTAAHELRTPLTSIQGFSEILMTREDLSGDEKKKFLHYINKQSISLAKIIRDLLDVSRIESRRGIAITKTKCDIKKIIEQVISYFEEQSQTHTFKAKFPEKSVELHVDKEKIEQILKNLIGNSVKYSPKGGDIKIDVEIDEKHCKFSVKDQGIGMTSEQVEKVFDKFYRADASETAPDGSGLGMTIVKYLVEAHNGKIWIESRKGKGTEVIFTIPLKPNQATNSI